MVVGHISTQHEGRGRTLFTPEHDEGLLLFSLFQLTLMFCIKFNTLVYHLRVIKPIGITKTVPLPEHKKSGLTIVTSKKVCYFCFPSLFLSFC